MSRAKKSRRSQAAFSPGRPATGAGVAAVAARQSRPDSSASEADAREAGRQSWFLVAAVTLLAARPLFPSEGADRGDGLPTIMLWLALAVMWWLFQAGRPRIRCRFGLPDAAVLVLTVVQTLSALFAVVDGTARPALNMLWEAVGTAVLFLLLRQFPWPSQRARSVLAVMVAVAVGVSCYGLYQYGVEMPGVREAYRRDPARYLRLAGLEEYLDQPETLRRFENRFFSTEPLATFALTNSLAGFLLPWGMILLAATGYTAARLRRGYGGGLVPDPKAGSDAGAVQSSARGFALGRAAVLAAGLGALGLCLILTKSRAGYLAALVGVMVLAWSCRTLWGRRKYQLYYLGGATLAVVTLLVVAALAWGGLDPLVLYEAGKSLMFRGQYWQATWRMILAHPWLGCGLGNFRFAYGQFRLPDASEDISDPHNFLFEVWATSGLFALAALLVILAIFFLRSRRHGKVEQRFYASGMNGLGEENASGGPGTPARAANPPANEIRRLWLALIFAWPLGLALSLVSSAPQTSTSLIVGLPIAAVTFWGLRLWVEDRDPRQGLRVPNNFFGGTVLCGTAVLVLMIHWLASGGWSYAGVSHSFWMLLAIGLSWWEDRVAATVAGEPIVRGSPTVSEKPTVGGEGDGWRAAPGWREVPGWHAVPGWVALTIACYATAYAPVLRCRAMMERVPRSDLDPSAALAALEAAAQADPLAVEPLLRRLAVLNAAWDRAGDRHHAKEAPSANAPFGDLELGTLRADLDRTAARLQRLSPNSDSVAFNIMLAYMRAAEVTGDGTALSRAEAAARRALELQPSQVLYRARLADILRRQGRSAEAARQAQAALRQDDAIRHPERKLPEGWRRRMEELGRPRAGL